MYSVSDLGNIDIKERRKKLSSTLSIISTSSVLYMAKATPPAPVKLKTSNSVFWEDPLGSANIR